MVENEGEGRVFLVRKCGSNHSENSYERSAMINWLPDLQPTPEPGLSMEFKHKKASILWWIKQNKCQICDGPGTEKHWLYDCKGWYNVSCNWKMKFHTRSR